MNRISKREWIGMLPATTCGALLGLLPGAQFIVPLLGPPVAYLFLRKRPLLSWQIPLIAAAILMGIREQDPQDPRAAVLLFAVLYLILMSLFSVFWPYIFQRRMQSDRDKAANATKLTKASLGVGFLIFLACGLIILGFVACFGPFPDKSIFDQSFGFLMATAGIGLAVYICCNARRLGLNFEIDSLFGWILAPIALTVIPGLFLDLIGSHGAPSTSSSTQLGPPLKIFLNYVACFEALAVVIWLLRRGRGVKRAVQSEDARSQA